MLDHGLDYLPYLSHFNFFDYILTLLSSPQGLSISCQSKCLRIIYLFLASEDLARILENGTLVDVNTIIAVLEGYSTSPYVQIKRLQSSAEIIQEMIVERFSQVDIIY